MIRGLEFAGFVALAAAVHAGIWSAASQDAGAGGGGGGDGGRHMATMSAASPQMTALIAAWERPVAVEASAPAPPQPLTAPEAPPPARPATDGAPALSPPPEAPPEAPRPSAPPQIDRRLAAPPRAPAPAPRPAQSALGDRTGPSAGRAEAQAPARRDDARNAGLMGQWGGAIRARIERQKRYPSGTRAQGTAHLLLDMGGDGRLLSVTVARSSGDARLDAAALDAVRRARLPAKPDGLPGDRHRFALPVAFSR
ncbi:MAG: TonB family protein [Roseovarius sp.]|nr:TonB family protein [Roseovarius sp.]